MNPSEDLGKAQLETTLLHRRIAELQLQLQHAQATADRRTEQIHQDYAAQVEKLSAEVSRQSAALQERESMLALQEQLLRGEIESLIRESDEKNQILLNRNDELVQTKSDRDRLQERFEELESATNQNEAAVSEETEQMRTEFQAQLALLQAELSQKEWALEEQRGVAIGLDQQYREQLETLNQELVQAGAHAQQEPDPFVIGAEKLNGEPPRASKYREVIDATTQGANRALRASKSRRWRTRFDWQRRWST